MNRLSIGLIFVTAWLCCAGAAAQWDSRDCSNYGINLTDLRSLESSLWTFRSNVWDGYIDFQEEGKYWTHFGYGNWTVTPEGKVHLANSYNNRAYDLEFTDNGFQFNGVRNDGLRISGTLLCAQYQGRGPQVPKDVAEQIEKNFKSMMDRLPTDKELRAQFRLYLQGASIDAVRDSLQTTDEYKAKAALKATEAAKNPESQFGW